MRFFKCKTSTSVLTALLFTVSACKQSATRTTETKSVETIKNVDSTGTMAASHTENLSKWMPLDENSLTYLADYAWLNKATGKREQHLEIWDKGLEMIGKAQKFVVLSVFLFDCMYSPTAPVRNMTEELLNAIITRKRQVPGLNVAVVLDPINRAYVNRIAPAVKKLNENGIDVFYTDMLVTPPAANTGIIEGLQESGVIIEQLDKDKIQGILTEAVNSDKLENFVGIQNEKVVIQDLLDGKPLKKNGEPVFLDGEPFNLNLIYNIGLLKANHRKLLVTDNGEFTEALVGSSNPHNASYPSANSAIAFRGNLAAFVYNVIREDIGHSISKYDSWNNNSKATPELRKQYATRFAMWSKPENASQYATTYLTEKFPLLSIQTSETQQKAEGRFVTESKIRDEIVRELNAVGKDDEVRIQMFYLSNPVVVDAILAAGKVTDKPIRLILDPNKDAFNSIKDGTPNRQVATYLRDEAKRLGSKIEIRWYDTHGEQNHAKVMSITNSQGKCLITTGSANWTGKNIGPKDQNSPNMESNLVVKGAPKLCNSFETLFEKFWNNETDKVYTVDWNTPPYNTHAGMEKWTKGEATGRVSW